MKKEHFVSFGAAGVFVLLTCVVGSLIVISRWYPAASWPIVPLIFPGIWIFGINWEERLGVWGARIVAWLISIPGTYLLAYLFSRIARSRRRAPPRL
jgi:hypothetical protein